MRLRVLVLAISVYFLIAVLGCSRKPAPADNSSSDNNQASSNNSSSNNSGQANSSGGEQRPAEHKQAQPQPVVVPSGTTITVSLGSALGSKLSQSGQTFSGSVSKDVIVGNSVVIPQGATVSGTVTDAKPLGKFAGGAELQVRLDSISLNGNDIPVHTGLRTFSAKGKGKRSAVITGGGAALGGIIGGLAGGGKGAAIGMLAGGGAGAGGSALTGNKDIVLPAESALSFQLSEPLELR